MYDTQLIENKKCYGYETVKELNILITEMQILEIFEKGFNKMIGIECKFLYKRGGKVWYTRFNVKNGGKDAFLIYFNPTEKERLSRDFNYLSSPIIEGVWSQKKFYIRNSSLDKFPHYVIKKYIPYIKNLLINIFEFEESKEQFFHY